MPTSVIEKFSTKWRDNENYKTAFLLGDLSSMDFDRLLLATLRLADGTFDLTPGYSLGDFVLKLIVEVVEDTGPPAVLIAIDSSDEFGAPNLPVFYNVLQPKPEGFEDVIVTTTHVRSITGFPPFPASVGVISFYGSKDITFEDFEDGWVSVL